MCALNRAGSLTTDLHHEAAPLMAEKVRNLFDSRTQRPTMAELTALSERLVDLVSPKQAVSVKPEI